MNKWRRFWRGPVFWMLAPCVLAGCIGGATPETKAMAAKLPEHFRQVRLEGKSWTDAEWDAKLRAYEGEACNVEEFVRTGTIAPGTAMRCRNQAKE